MCSLYSTVNIVRLAGSGSETCTRRIRLGRRLLAALDACYGKQISIPSLKFSTHSAQRCFTLNGCQTKEMEKQKKNTVSRKKNAPPTHRARVAPPDNARRRQRRRRRLKLRTAKWELGTTSWQVGTGKGRGKGSGNSSAPAQRCEVAQGSNH